MAETMLATRIKELRKRLSMNQKDFAASLNIQQSTLSSYENGTITPSTEILLAIAQKYNVSLDWLFGISQRTTTISSLSDVLDFIFRMNELNEIRYELDIHDHLFNDWETETDKWYASLKFYGNDSEHRYNAPLCQVLGTLNYYRDNFESYFSSKEHFDYWKKEMLEFYGDRPVSQKVYEDLDYKEIIRRRDALMDAKYGKKNN